MNEVITGDCLTTLKTLEQNSVDCLVTDPPYGYSFMGKDWDKAVPSVDVWKECLRVLKPGAFAFVMSAPRQDVLSQMIVRLGMAGFDISFSSLYHTYASGFPKAANVGKLVDKRLGAEREVIGKSDNKIHLENLGNAGYKEQWDITKAATPQAKALEGSYAGFQPKPAVEVIIVCMKPLSEKTYVDQALANGKGITWLDDARIPYQNEDDRSQTADKANKDIERYTNISEEVYGKSRHEYIGEFGNTKGRFPANLLVSDDVLNDGRITKSNGHAPANRGDFLGSNGIYGKAIDNQEHIDYKFNDSGSYSRYFDLDKWAEKTLPFLIVPKASKSEKDKGLEDMPEKQVMGGGGTYNEEAGRKFGSIKTSKHNSHPTVKPLKLMSYLITLGSRQGDVILDPFAGSGTTCVAAKQLGRQYIGLELSPEYSEIARKRIEAITQTIL